MILEIALFFSSYAKYDRKRERYQIKNIMGPDEFHEQYRGKKEGGINNNAYTNVLVVWVIEKALYIIEKILSKEDKNSLLVKIGITKKDINCWKSIIKKMYIPIDKGNNIIEQFDGYFKLKEIDWEKYQKKYNNIHRMDRILEAEGESADMYKISKQADVLMLFYIFDYKELKNIFKRLGYNFSKKMIEDNFKYYLKRCSHGSTLSKVVHSYVSYIIDGKDLFRKLFFEAMESDIYDTQKGTTQEGIHLGMMGATVDLFLRCYGGVSVKENYIKIEPRIPKEWKRIKFSVKYKRIWIEIECDHNNINITPNPMYDTTFNLVKKISIEINRQVYQIKIGETFRVRNNNENTDRKNRI